MKLYTFYKENDKVVYGTFIEGKTQFFYSGFKSAEDAKNATFEAHLAYKMEQNKPNNQGCARPNGMLRAEIEMTLTGEWKEIE